MSNESSPADPKMSPDPLPSWNRSEVKRTIIEFVGQVSDSTSANFIPQPERIAVFDNDGTLWSERPYYFQLAFALDRIALMAQHNPDWKITEPMKSLVQRDITAIHAIGEKALAALVNETHAGMTTDAFDQTVTDWLETARHPRFNQLYADLIFQPMLELMDYLRANGFKTFIVSGGGVEFIRVFAETVYGIPPEQVLGSSGAVSYHRDAGGTVTMVKEPRIEFIDDGPGKPVGIVRFIGRQPIFAFGNSDGDQAMLQYVAARSGPRFVGLIHHTDAAREFSYDREAVTGKLDAALDEAYVEDWLVVDMRKDWNVVYPRGITPAE